MTPKYSQWLPLSEEQPKNFPDLQRLLNFHRNYEAIPSLNYGDHGLHAAIERIISAIKNHERIALYADYDVDGTMSCVSWIWFFRAIGYKNFIHYIPCRFKEGYGLNLKAIQHLVEQEKAQLVITMDTGITANEEAAYCRERGVGFICTDHHKIQPEKMPDCLIVNPKMHPDPAYQELCGCGVTFVVLRKISEQIPVAPKIWTDLLALTGIATICDVVPLNAVNHQLAKRGVDALLKSDRPVLKALLQAASVESHADEQDIGFRIGPRINAVGRLEHADIVVKAFVSDDYVELVQKMSVCNERRKQIQQQIVKEAYEEAKKHPDDPILFLGGSWHPGVVGIAASKVAESFWRPTWLFDRGEAICKGSARSIEGFDVTDCMGAAKSFYTKFGGHRAAGGFSFDPKHEKEIKEAMLVHAQKVRSEHPELWVSSRRFDCYLPSNLLNLELCESLAEMRPFGHGFSEPVFALRGHASEVSYYRDKQTNLPKHTALVFQPNGGGSTQKIMYFNEVLSSELEGLELEALCTASKNRFKGRSSLSLIGVDIRVMH